MTNLFDTFSSLPNPSSLTSPSDVTEKGTAMSAALLAIVDEFEGYKSSQQEPPILSMYVSKIEAMAYNLDNFYTLLLKDKANIQTYIEVLNTKIKSLMAENSKIEMASSQVSSKTSLSSTMQSEIKLTMEIQNYINYSLYAGIVLETLAIGYALYFPN